LSILSRSLALELRHDLVGEALHPITDKLARHPANAEVRDDLVVADELATGEMLIPTAGRALSGHDRPPTELPDIRSQLCLVSRVRLRALLGEQFGMHGRRHQVVNQGRQPMRIAPPLSMRR